jgi:hypothetical protein
MCRKKKLTSKDIRLKLAAFVGPVSLNPLNPKTEFVFRGFSVYPAVATNAYIAVKPVMREFMRLKEKNLPGQRVGVIPNCASMKHGIRRAIQEWVTTGQRKTFDFRERTCRAQERLRRAVVSRPRRERLMHVPCFAPDRVPVIHRNPLFGPQAQKMRSALFAERLIRCDSLEKILFFGKCRCFVSLILGAYGERRALLEIHFWFRC